MNDFWKSMAFWKSKTQEIPVEEGCSEKSSCCDDMDLLTARSFLLDPVLLGRHSGHPDTCEGCKEPKQSKLQLKTLEEISQELKSVGDTAAKMKRELDAKVPKLPRSVFVFNKSDIIFIKAALWKGCYCLELNGKERCICCLACDKIEAKE